MRRARLLLAGSVVVSAVVLFAWFPATSLLSQRSSLRSSQAQLSNLHAQDAALAQEKKNLDKPDEIGRIAREQYQLVSPGQHSYQVLPPTGASGAKAPYAGDPGSSGPVVPSAASELPPGAVTTTTTTAPSAAGSSTAPSKGQSKAQAPSGVGFLTRVAQTLEFWR
jgi:cell division protein FtsB